MSRPYRQKRRAEQQRETRRRIVQATVELHEELGPAETTIRAIAERAGVQRLTVYRHFPDERSLFGACSAHYTELHPLPSCDRWATIGAPAARTRSALTEIYDYYQSTEPMMSKIVRDVSRVPALAEQFDSVSAEVRRGQEILVDAWAVDDDHRPLISAAVGHAMAFQSWQSLVRQQGLDPADAVEMMLALIQAVASDYRSPSG